MIVEILCMILCMLCCKFEVEGMLYSELLMSVCKVFVIDYFSMIMFSIEDIVLMFGFSDVVGFCYVFKCWIGMMLSDV